MAPAQSHPTQHGREPEYVQVTVSATEGLTAMGQARWLRQNPRLAEWSVTVTGEWFAPATLAGIEALNDLRAVVGESAVLSLLKGESQWVVFRPAKPTPYFVIRFDSTPKIVQRDLCAIMDIPTVAEWAELAVGLRLVGMFNAPRRGRPRGRRKGLDPVTSAAKKRELARLVQHDGVSMDAAIARLELDIDPRTGWRWLQDPD
jgi:hypothetical protein